MNQIELLELRQLLSFAFGEPSTFPTGAGPHSLATADFNGDGNIDVAVTSANDDVDPDANVDELDIFLGDGTGQFGAKKVLATGFEVFDVAAGDFNGDAKADLIVSNAGDATIGFYAGDGKGGFAKAVESSFGTEDHFTQLFAHLASADFNADGKPDAAVFSGDDSVVQVMLNQGDGTFKKGKSFATSSIGEMITADFNGDENADLAFSNGIG